MRSRTSSSDLRIFKKALTRFAPVWAEYSVFLLIVQYFLWSGEGDISARYSPFVGLFALVNAIYGFVVAVALFGYLTDPRECGVVHTFPVRREKYFAIHLVAGFLMALVPNGVFCLLNIPMAENGVLFSFAGMMLEFVFFYGLAVFCMLLTGRKFAAATVYALINWLSLLVLWAAQVIYLPQLPGVTLNTEVFYQLCPVVGMMFRFARQFDTWLGTDLEQLRYIAVCALIGLGLMAGALELYRRRRLEYAGDFLAVKWLNPVFLAVFSIACGCVLSVFGMVFFDESALLMLVIGLLIGYFSGRMLMEKTAKVFRLRSVLAGMGLVGAVLASVFIVELDPLGRVMYVPEPEEVARVEIAPSENYLDGYISNLNPYRTEDPAIIGELTDLHSDYLGLIENSGEYYNGFVIRYRLKNGTMLLRDYTDNYSSNRHGLEDRIEYYYSQPECVLDVESLEEFKEISRWANVSLYDGGDSYEIVISGSELTELQEAFYADCVAGNMSGQLDYIETNVDQFYITFENNRGVYMGRDVAPDAQATRAVCEKLMEKYTDWESGAEEIPTATVNWRNVTRGVSDARWILSHLEKASPTDIPSVNDAPTNVEDWFAITLDSDQWSTVYLYEKDGAYYFEVPYQGVWQTWEDVYAEFQIYMEG